MNVEQVRVLASVSVVIPAYCAKATIAGAIESVAAQTLRPMEVIVVDDGSGDGTADFVRTLASRYETGWLKLLALEHNVGAASARNAGWAVACGKYIAFLDADDRWHTKKIECQYVYMLAHPDVALCGHEYSIVRNSEPGEMVACTGRAKKISTFHLLMFNPFVTPSAMVRSDIQLRFMAGKRYTDDHLLWMEIALSGLHAVRLPVRLALISKALFGASGLSSQLWAMEKGELHNYWHLKNTGRIQLVTAIGLMTFSLAKYLRRILIVAARRTVR